MGQLGKLRADCESARAAILNRRAGWHPAPHGSQTEQGRVVDSKGAGSRRFKDNEAMSGIQFVTDEKGRKVAVQINLKVHREL